jgi:hypothetical protein
MIKADRTIVEENRLRPIGRRTEDVASAASMIGLWLLIPMAIGGLAFVILGLGVLASTDDLEPQVPWQVWLPVTLVMQASFWVLVAYRAGRHPLEGLWGLLPVIGLIPTFAIAHSALVAPPIMTNGGQATPVQQPKEPTLGADPSTRVSSGL